MHERIEVSSGVPIYAWMRGVPFEDSARRQVENVARLPFVHSHVAVMPDVHAGLGATVGTVVATRGAVIPAAVGVDIGCGMIAWNTDFSRGAIVDDTLPALRARIERAIPHGRTCNGGPGDRGAWGTLPADVERTWRTMLADRYAALLDAVPEARSRNTVAHLGTLGTGNHFVELATDEDGDVWAVIHSGSRGMGARFGTTFTRIAKDECERAGVELADRDLAHLTEGTPSFDAYWRAVTLAQDFAAHNRRLMLARVLDALADHLGVDATPEGHGFDCRHNYVARETHDGREVFVTRKGAVRARAGDWGIIPGSMGARSYIVRGKGSADSFESCSHGAGRTMSRTEAKRRITVEQLAEATAGVECAKTVDVIDEAPQAYKSIDAVMEAQSDLVDVRHTLKQFLCVKGA